MSWADKFNLLNGLVILRLTVALHFLVDEPYGRSTHRTVVTPDGVRRPLAALGLAAETRLGRGNPAHHIPDGIALFYGDDFLATSNRDVVDALPVALLAVDLPRAVARVLRDL